MDFINANMEQIGWVSIILAIAYASVLAAIISDLCSGVRKAKERGELRTSYGYKRTVTKICTYFNALIALTFFDLVLMVMSTYLDHFYGYSIPVLPVTTCIGALFIDFIEIKSIKENASIKAKNEYHQLAVMISEILKHSNDKEGAIKAVIDYMEGKNNESERKTDKQD